MSQKSAKTRWRLHKWRRALNRQRPSDLRTLLLHGRPPECEHCRQDAVVLMEPAGDYTCVGCMSESQSAGVNTYRDVRPEDDYERPLLRQWLRE